MRSLRPGSRASARLLDSRPTSARGSGTAGRSASRTRPFPARSREFPCRSRTTTRATPARTRSRPTPRSREGRARRATGTCSSSIVTRAGCGSSTARIRSRADVVDGRVGRDLGSQLERDASARLDVGRRSRTADPARARPLRRGRGGRDRPRHPLHGAANGQRVRLAGEPQGGDRRRVGSADGGMVPTQGELRHQPLLGARTR